MGVCPPAATELSIRSMLFGRRATEPFHSRGTSLLVENIKSIVCWSRNLSIRDSDYFGRVASRSLSSGRS